MKINPTIISLTFLGLLASCAVPGQPVGGSTKTYNMISVSELQALRESGEDFLFVNVHIPLEGNIPGTDFTVPFNEVDQNLNLFPEDKDAKIVIYCRSDNMGHDAAQTLVDNGYTDVSNLEGGYVEWKAQGLPFEE
jgi:rhodanese-related sulfurtransferase